MFENIPLSYAEIRAEDIHQQEEALVAAEEDASRESHGDGLEPSDSGQIELKKEASPDDIPSASPKVDPVKAKNNEGTGIIVATVL